MARGANRDLRDPAGSGPPPPRRKFGKVGDHEVGYGRPPQEHRFRSGQSGNPRGRPPTLKPPRNVLEEALLGSVSVTEAGESKVIDMREALFKSMLAKAIKGDMRAASLVIKLAEKFGIARPDGDQIQQTVIYLPEQLGRL